MPKECEAILKKMESMHNPVNIAGMARFGIKAEKIHGITSAQIRQFAKETRRNHSLALELWESKVYDARILAGTIGEPKKMTESQMENWVKDFDSWAVCDHTCMFLFRKCANAHEMAQKWAKRKEEFTRRTGFALIASLVVWDKGAEDEKFAKYFPLISKYSTDERLYVKKAVNWALRQIGKRNLNLNKLAIRTARKIQKMDSKSARWIAGDALRELEGEAVQKRLKAKPLLIK